MMPHKFRPVTALLLFTGLNAILVSTITPVYDSVCFHPYWERRVCFLSLIVLDNKNALFFFSHGIRKHTPTKKKLNGKTLKSSYSVHSTIGMQQRDSSIAS